MEYSYNEKFKGVLAKPNSTEEWLEFIHDIGYDYDGYNTVKGLKSLIDEMVEAAQEGLACLRNGYILYDADADEESHKRAIAKADTFKKNKVGICPKCGYKYSGFTDMDYLRCPECKIKFDLMEV